MINVFVIEEHQEAFFIWLYAALKEIIPGRNNIILHVDEHSDMNTPTLRTSPKKVGPALHDILSFARNQLGISEFIVPAIHRKLIKEVYWIRRDNKYAQPEKTLNVFSHKREGRILYITDNAVLAGMFNPDRASAVFHQISHDSSITPSGPAVLDIDLDYFYCDYDTGEQYDVQVTETEYNAFHQDPYHRLRMMAGGKLRAEKRDEQYYYIYRPGPVRKSPTFNPEEITQRIESFIDWLQTNNIQPALIDICRSRFSGFTPVECWKWIEEHLVQGLRKLYPIKLKYFDELIDEEGLIRLSDIQSET